MTNIYNIQVDSKYTIHANLREIKMMLQQHTSNAIARPYTKITPTTLRPLSVFTNPPTKLWESLTSKNFGKKTVRIYITTKKGNKNNETNTTMGPTATCRIGLMETPFTFHNTHWPSQTLAMITTLILALTTVKKNTTIKLTIKAKPNIMSLIN